MPSKFFLQVNEVMVGQTCEEAYTSRRAERSQDLERDVRIEVYEHTRIISWGPAIDIGWEGDTSTSFGIGVLIGKTWAQFKLVNQHNNPKDILLLETVAVRLGLLMALGMRDQKGKRLIVWTVNTMTENGINNKKSRDIATNAKWVEIQKLLLRHHVDIVAKRVMSKNNKADALSRGLWSGQDVKHQFIIDLPADLTDLVEQIMDELFLSSIKDFTSDGQNIMEPSDFDLYVLNGWQKATLKGYNSAVRKFLHGLKAWHNYHGQPYPAGIEKRVALMVKSAAKEDAKRPKKTVKPAVKLHHLLVLADGLATGSNKDLAILDLAIITFWGMARLKELVFTDHMVTGDAPTGADGILARDKQSASIV
ncbi:hypothetical protein PSTG_02061 [Puccinia striiformis f. sp. tritici PST-78]|uniref:Uncharacterized protein n=1 Tax=Puccinia striiformis f. sp. tritici PST-78 TaxID=1165861 RepID=A0A0L0W185_9BASI|nr:hypothetical protein PSTG_02061 [Puccinia striiformis f. sp. tritici PST-78]